MRPCLVASCVSALLLAAWSGEGLAATILELARDGKPAAWIVAGADSPAPAQALCDGLRQALGVELPVVAHEAVMEPGNWRLRAEWLDRPLVVVGSVPDNRVMFALFSRFLEGANASYPGPGRYTLRVLSQPFRRGVHLLSLGASDGPGLDAGVARLVKLAAEKRGTFGPLVEIGEAKGPVAPPPSSAGDFIYSASRYYWEGDPAAGQQARELLLAEARKPGQDLWGTRQGGHYDWERYYRPLRQLLASGLLSDDERHEVEVCLVATALDSQDWAGLTVLRAPRGAMPGLLTRHPISGLIGHFIIYEYLATVGDVPADKQADIARGYALLRGHIESLLEAERFMSNEVGTQGSDNLSYMADAYLALGDGRAVERGLLRRMADFYLASKDNLGYHAGDDAYITCRPGSHRSYSSGGLPLLLAAYLHRDGQYRWLLEHTHHFMSHMQVPQPPEITALVAGIPPEAPTRYRGLNLLPPDSWWRARCTNWKADELMAPLKAPREQAFAKVVFRDGHDPSDAYLMLQGVNLGYHAGGEGFSANSIVRYTELGSVLLFANTIKQTSWARSLVSASRGEADPQSTGCALGAHFAGDLVSGVESVQDNEGGLSWSRSLVHRSRGYFVVLDALTARQEDTYNLTCRWRSFHPGALVGDRRFEAVDGMLGVRFRLLGATPASWQVQEEDRPDGASRPTMVRQFQRLRLRPGETASFHNLFYACGRDHPRSFDLRPWTDHAVLVKGKTDEQEELAAIGGGPLRLSAISAEGRLWYVSPDAVYVAGAAGVRLPGLLSLDAEEGVSMGLLPKGAAWLENPSPRPVRLSVRSYGAASVRLDGSTVAAGLDLSPGRHQLDLDLAPFFARLSREVRGLWDSLHSVAAPAPAKPPARDRLRFTPAWTCQGVPPPYQRYADVLASADPPVQIGSAANWRDHLLGPPAGYGWHGSERAGWLPGTQGAIVLDLGRETDIREIRLVRSRGPGNPAPFFRPDEFSFSVALSNDGFRTDLRKKEAPKPGFDVLYSENQLYMYTRRFPVLVAPIGERARYVRLTPRRGAGPPEPSTSGYGKLSDGTYGGLLQEGEISFMEVEVVLPTREPRIEARLWARDFGAPDGPRILYQAGTHLMVLSPEGKPLWDRDLGAPLAAEPVLADIDGDGREEVLTFTLAEDFAAHDLAGKERFTVPVRAATRDEESSGLCSARPACVAAWRPDAARQFEYLFFPHYNCYRVSPAPELVVTHIEHPGGNRGGKFAFTVPDVTGDGREELAVVGLYGFCFGVIPSETPLEQGRLPSYLGLAPLTGYSSGNQELRLYHDGAVVKDSAGTWLGVVAINPGGIDFFAPRDFAKRWSHFNHPPNLCRLLADLNGDGKPEILLGREDGYLVAYEVEQGRVVAKTALDGAVRSLALCKGRIVAGTERGLTLLDLALKPVAHRDGPVEAVAVVDSPSDPLIIAAHSGGEVAAYRVRGPG